MNVEQAKKAVAQLSRVRLNWSGGQQYAEGRAVAYSVVPMVLIQTDSGEKIWWRQDMAECVTAPGDWSES